MKVLFITHCVNMGGGNFSLLQLMKELSQPPYNVEPILLAPLDSPSYSSSILREAKSIGIKCISARFCQFKWESRSIGNYLRYFSNIINYSRILRIVKREKVDLIHSNSSVIDIGGFLASKLKVKHVWHLREFGDLDFGLKSLLGKSYEKSVYTRSDRFIAISESVKRRFLPFIEPASKIEVIYNGLPQKHKTFIPHSEKCEEVNFCISGSLNPAKRQIDALRAMDILVNERGIRNIHLFILGEGGDKAALEHFCKERGIERYVTFTGWVKDVDYYYSRCQVGLMLSVNEGFGRVTIDYMRSGMAIIASNGGANPELITANETGLFIPVADYKALADKMTLMVENPALRETLGRNALEYSLSHFRSEDNTKGVFDVYQKIMSERL